MDWPIMIGIVACALAALFAVGLGRAAATGDTQLARRAGHRGTERRGGTADRRRSRRPWSHRSAGRRPEDRLAASLRRAAQDVETATAALEQALAARAQVIARAAAEGVPPAEISAVTGLSPEEVDFVVGREARAG